MDYVWSTHEGGLLGSSDPQGNNMSTGIVHTKSKRNTTNIQVDNGKGGTQNGTLISHKGTLTQQSTGQV